MGLFHHVLVYMRDLHLVLPSLNLSPGCWHLENGATGRFDDVFLEHGGLPFVPFAVHLKFVHFCVSPTPFFFLSYWDLFGVGPRGVWGLRVCGLELTID